MKKSRAYRAGFLRVYMSTCILCSLPIAISTILFHIPTILQGYKSRVDRVRRDAGPHRQNLQ